MERSCCRVGRRAEDREGVGLLTIFAKPSLQATGSLPVALALLVASRFLAPLMTIYTWTSIHSHLAIVPDQHLTEYCNIESC